MFADQSGCPFRRLSYIGLTAVLEELVTAENIGFAIPAHEGGIDRFMDVNVVSYFSPLVA